MLEGLRRARAGDAELLGRLTMAALASHGHLEQFPELMAAFEREQLPGELDLAGPAFRVLDGDDGPVAYYEVVVTDDGDADLRRMFITPERIGTGIGRELWPSIVADAVEVGTGDRLRVVSDPGAVGFYRRMGCEAERTHEVAPGFVLTVMWCDLTGHP